MKDQVELLKESCDMKDSACVRYQNRISELEKENKKLKNSIAYWKRKADENQEKADEINKILRIPWILKEDWKIDRPKVAFSYII